MLTWGELRAQVRESLLKDVPDEVTGAYRWSDSELLTYCGWALTTFARHTAVATATSFAPATGLDYDLPSNLYSGEPLDLTGQVFIIKQNGDVEYLNPIRHTGGLDPFTSSGFYTYPESVLHLTTAFGDSDILTVRYFAHYNVPTASADFLDVPHWALSPLAYLIAAHALSGASLKSASIRQWGTKPDTGSPEQNPLRLQQQWFLDMYERELQRYTPQERVNHFRNIAERY